ncbi:MAG: hypothetical protein ACLSES_02045 [Christensenellales bacterium]
MVNVMIVEDQKLVRSILESYIKKEGNSCCPPCAWGGQGVDISTPGLI